MKLKQSFFAFLTMCGLFLSGCESEAQNIQSNNKAEKLSHNEVIDRHGQVENLERLNIFVEKVQSGSNDKIKLIRYTIEGDPIYHNLDFDGTSLTLTYDNTEDKFGQGEVTTYTCKNMTKYESNTETKYMLQGCPNPNMGEILHISHDVEKEDYFAFELRYGEEKKNEIDTKGQKFTKDLKNGETMTINDFQLSTEQMNLIYKQMVYANFLQPKTLSNSCNKESFDVYELNIWINGGTRNYEWTSCDQSQDGREMTALIQNIIEIVEETL